MLEYFTSLDCASHSGVVWCLFVILYAPNLFGLEGRLAAVEGKTHRGREAGKAISKVDIWEVPKSSP